LDLVYADMGEEFGFNGDVGLSVLQLGLAEVLKDKLRRFWSGEQPYASCAIVNDGIYGTCALYLVGICAVIGSHSRIGCSCVIGEVPTHTWRFGGRACNAHYPPDSALGHKTCRVYGGREGVQRVASGEKPYPSSSRRTIHACDARPQVGRDLAVQAYRIGTGGKRPGAGSIRRTNIDGVISWGKVSGGTYPNTTIGKEAHAFGIVGAENQGLIIRGP
jgi:hypothetical protein